ncbi:unnamed protein product [Paramecium primaurelia]|uniref:Reverse transcriptase domain-containing protein n=1 Tax=Paramecium primaurelia TaxID=5886 RepID=A0A8S1MY25_PARPR|nr:unnamed protein product [Paramecium primaurelia]
MVCIKTPYLLPSYLTFILMSLFKIFYISKRNKKHALLSLIEYADDLTVVFNTQILDQITNFFNQQAQTYNFSVNLGKTRIPMKASQQRSPYGQILVEKT